MKKNHFSAVFVILICTLFSCNNDKKTATESVTVTDTLSAATADTTKAIVNADGVALAYDQVPDTIKTAFTTKHPSIRKYEWYSYQPVASDDLGPDQSYYYVRFNDNGADYTTWFDSQGEWVKTSTRIPGNKNLPDAVNQYLNVNYEGYEIEEINKENDKNMDMYEIKLNKGGNKVKLKILPDGQIFKRKSN